MAAVRTATDVTADAPQILSQITRTLGEAYNLETAIDAYQGLPTAAQLRDLDWAWEDAIGAVTALNRLIQQDLPGGSPVPVPVRR